MSTYCITVYCMQVLHRVGSRPFRLRASDQRLAVGASVRDVAARRHRPNYRRCGAGGCCWRGPCGRLEGAVEDERMRPKRGAATSPDARRRRLPRAATAGPRALPPAAWSRTVRGAQRLPELEPLALACARRMRLPRERARLLRTLRLIRHRFDFTTLLFSLDSYLIYSNFTFPLSCSYCLIRIDNTYAFPNLLQ